MDLFLLAFDLSSQLQYFSLDGVELFCIFEEYFLLEFFELLCPALKLVNLLILLEDSVIYVPHCLADIL